MRHRERVITNRKKTTGKEAWKKGKGKLKQREYDMQSTLLRFFRASDFKAVA